MGVVFAVDRQDGKPSAGSIMSDNIDELSRTIGEMSASISQVAKTLDEHAKTYKKDEEKQSEKLERLNITSVNIQRNQDTINDRIERVEFSNSDRCDRISLRIDSHEKTIADNHMDISNRLEPIETRIKFLGWLLTGLTALFGVIFTIIKFAAPYFISKG